MYRIIKILQEFDYIKTEIRMICNCSIEELKDFDMDKLRMLRTLLLQGHKFDKLKDLSYEQLWTLQKIQLMEGFMKVNIGDILTLEDGTHVKVINFDSNDYYVIEVDLTPWKYTLKDKKYCINKRSIISNLGRL